MLCPVNPSIEEFVQKFKTHSKETQQSWGRTKGSRENRGLIMSWIYFIKEANFIGGKTKARTIKSLCLQNPSLLMLGDFGSYLYVGSPYVRGGLAAYNNNRIWV